MRELTFRGFLARYVRQLSGGDTLSIFKLAQEAEGANPRLREPLLLYAVYSGKEEILLRAVKGAELKAKYAQLLSGGTSSMTARLECRDPALSEEYHKVWRSYQTAKNRTQSDGHTKELMRRKVKRLQERTGVTNYRIYKDLNLNPGNVNAWLKHGAGDKISLENARNVVRYVEGKSLRVF